MFQHKMEQKNSIRENLLSHEIDKTYLTSTWKLSGVKMTNHWAHKS